jgi:hypothetical protein
VLARGQLCQTWVIWVLVSRTRMHHVPG